MEGNGADRTVIPEKVEQYIDLKWKSQIFDSQISFKIKPQRRKIESNIKLADADNKNEAFIPEGSDELTLR